jgi:putative transposase
VRLRRLAPATPARPTDATAADARPELPADRSPITCAASVGHALWHTSLGAFIRPLGGRGGGGQVGSWLDRAYFVEPDAEHRAGNTQPPDAHLELLVLRQELFVLRRTSPRPRWRTADRLILAALGRKLSAGAQLLVQPATVLGWHRALVHRRWAAFGRRRGPGRPKVPAECQRLVLQLARENPLWGYECIRGELLKLGYRVSSTSIRNLLRQHGLPPAPRRAGLTWRRFLKAHGRAILACDYFTVDTVFLKRRYVLFFLELASRRILFTACSEHPGGAWAAQQARNLAWQLQEAEVRPRFLIHDRDSNFPAAFDAVFRAEGLEIIRTPVRAPNANSRCERWVSSVRRECLDWLLILGRRHLEAVLASTSSTTTGTDLIAAWNCDRRVGRLCFLLLPAVKLSAGRACTG